MDTDPTLAISAPLPEKLVEANNTTDYERRENDQQQQELHQTLMSTNKIKHSAPTNSQVSLRNKKKGEHTFAF